MSDRRQRAADGSELAAARGATLAREVLERAVTDLDEGLSVAERSDVLAAYDETVRALRGLVEASPLDPSYVDQFDRTCTGIEALAAQVEALGEPSRAAIAGRISKAAQSLRRRRDVVLDQMITAQSTGGVDRAEPGAAGRIGPLRPSSGLPQLHHLPSLNLAALRRRGSGPVQDDMPPPPASSPEQPPPAPPQLKGLARECLEAMGRMSMLCRLEGDRAWTNALSDFEQRLLDNLDALLALGRPDLDPRGGPPPGPQPDSDLDSLDQAPTEEEIEPPAVPIDWTRVELDPPQLPEDQKKTELDPSRAEPTRDGAGDDEEQAADETDQGAPEPERVGAEPSEEEDSAPRLEAGPDLVRLPCTVDVAEAVMGYTSEAPGDAHRAFVRSFVLGCLAGEEPVRAAVSLLRRVPPGTLSAHSRALALAPNPAVEAAMDTLCRDGDPRLTKLAMDVLRQRGQVQFAQVATLIAHPNAEVRQSAARALATTDERSAAAELLASQVEGELDDHTLAVLAEALLRVDDRRGLAVVRSRLAEELEFQGSLPSRARRALLRLLALSGDASDVATLIALAEQPADLVLLGWYGHADTVNMLLEVLAEPTPPALFSAAETRPLAAARALQRITSAMGEDSAPRGFGYRPDAVNPDVDAWRAWWAEHQERFAPGIKYRHGQPFSVEASLAELGQSGVAQDVRECAALELGVLSGAGRAPWLGNWSYRFDAELADWREHFRRFTGTTGSPLHAAGEWPARRLGERHRAIANAKDSPRDRDSGQDADRQRSS